MKTQKWAVLPGLLSRQGIVAGAGILLLVSISLSPFTSAQSEEDQVQFSGFLGDYSALQPDPQGRWLLLYLKSEDVLKDYTKFIIDPVFVYFQENEEGNGFDPEEISQLTDYFRRAVAEELAKSDTYRVVFDPGPGVARFRIAITNVNPGGRKGNMAVKAVGTGVGMATVPLVGMFTPRVSLGDASVEAELLDSLTEERIAAMVDTRTGGRRFFSFISGLKKWSDVHAAFRTWAKEFREDLDRVHGE
jgi:hypothetical protein